MSWTECPECEASLKEANAEEHVRKQHPREYMDHYPDASQRTGMAPCPVCWEWHSLEEPAVAADSGVLKRTDMLGNTEHYRYVHNTPELELHVAREHPGEYDEHFEGGCIACALGMCYIVWREFDDEIWDFVFGEDGAKPGAARAVIESESGAIVTEELAAEHFDQHIELEITANETMSFIHDRAQMVDGATFIPSKLEMDVRDATEPGDRVTVPELAEATGYTDTGVRNKLEDMTHYGLLRRVEDGRPAVYERLEEDSYPDRDAWEARRAYNDEVRENWNEDPKHIHESYQERPGLGLEPTKPIY